ncbi:MAG: hypothetical protein WA461_12220, partial [Nitrososphaeraceae archaeon]
MKTTIKTTLGILLLFLMYPISSTTQMSYQQYVFGQDTNVSSSSTPNKLGTGLAFPQIHNFTSTPPAPVNSWIIESENGVVIIDT